MTVETFHQSLKRFVRQVPFRPFFVELMSGERIRVTHPEALAFDAGRAAYLSPNGGFSMFNHDSVSRVHDEPDDER